MKRICQRCGAVVEKQHRCRGNPTARGYDGKWERFRKWFLDKHRWTCQDCGAVKSRRVTLEVHHIEKLADHPELRLVESNCMALCRECHAKRTARGE